MSLIVAAQTASSHRSCCRETVLSGHGIAIPTSCAEGVCGTCLTRVLDGEVLHRDMLLTAEERARNDQFTPCCSRAASRVLVLDLQRFRLRGRAGRASQRRQTPIPELLNVLPGSVP